MSLGARQVRDTATNPDNTIGSAESRHRPTPNAFVLAGSFSPHSTTENAGAQIAIPVDGRMIDCSRRPLTRKEFFIFLDLGLPRQTHLKYRHDRRTKPLLLV